MKHTIIIAIAAGTLAGFLSGILSRTVFRPAEPHPHAESIAPAPGPAHPELHPSPSDEDVELLRSRIAELELRLAIVEAESGTARQPADEGSGAPLAEAADDLALSELASALRRPGAQLPETLKLGVEQVMQDVRDAERRERDAQRAAAMVDRTEAQLAELVTALDLTPVQTDAMRDHLTTYEAKRAELRDSARETGDFEGIRDSLRSLRDESRTNLALILDPTQLELYRETEDDRRSRGDRRGGRDEGN